MRKRYTDPKAAGCLLEARACAALVKELDCLLEKYRRKIAREDEARHRDLAAVLEYSSEQELQEAYGFAEITEQQYSLYRDLLEQGEAALEHHAPTQAELVCDILQTIRADIDSERAEWEFSALTPEERTKERERAEASSREWRARIQEIRTRRRMAGQ